MTNDTLLFIVGTFGMSLMAISIIVFALIYQRKIEKKNRQISEVENLLTRSELKGTYALIQGQNQERKKIARDLHDHLGSQMAIIKLKLNSLLPRSSHSTEDLNMALDTAIAQIRGFSHELNRAMLGAKPLHQVLLDFTNEITEHSDLNMEFYSFGLESNITEEISEIILRTTQELVTNTLKHAHASKAVLEINYFVNDHVNMVFHDDGMGFDIGKQGKGIGFKNIEQRVNELNGKLTIHSKLNHGSEFVIEIPLDNYG